MSVAVRFGWEEASLFVRRLARMLSTSNLCRNEPTGVADRSGIAPAVTKLTDSNDSDDRPASGRRSPSVASSSRALLTRTLGKTTRSAKLWVNRTWSTPLLVLTRSPLKANIVTLPGDGIGPEIVAQGILVLDAVANRFGHEFSYSSHRIGGIAIDSCGDPLPQQTIDACRASDAILLGAVGGPKWDDPSAKTRPEAGLLKIRKELGLFANLRPIRLFDQLIDASPLRREIIEGTDILFLRELTGGIYFGESGRTGSGANESAFQSMVYSVPEVERIVRLAAQAAQGRDNRLTSVDKANVLEPSRLWRQVAARVMAEEFPDVKYDVVLVDAMAMHLINRPRDFDVVVTGNMFGDILTDEASMLPGSLGMLPSASLGDGGPGLYEPIHGSAPDIAGKGIANPLATILAVAMMLRHSLSLASEADAIEAAVEKALADGLRTADIARTSDPSGGEPIGTEAMGSAVIQRLSV
jgi:3-isopropylmalate dehydrogenase